MARPKGELSDLLVPKDGDEPAAPPAAATISAKGYAHTLSLRLTAEHYRRLRLHVRAQEDAAPGARVTHQGIIEAALSEYLDRHGG